VAEGEQPNIPSPFDVRTIKYLVRLMGRHDLSEVDLREGDLRIRLRRGAREQRAAALVLPTGGPAPSLAPPAAAAEQPTPAQTTPAADAGKKLIEIKSPTPGTFYSAANPDADPFVRVGTRIQPDTVVCIVEAMKVFNEIQAECSGVVVAILVENQQAVEYGQVLFKVDSTA
jgi:acetyl-CoA carboxylase biotin carboxyl carrier protein